MVEMLQLPWVQRVAFALGGVLLGFLVERVLVARLHKLVHDSRFKWDDLVVESIHSLPAIWLGAAGIYLAIGVGDVPPVVTNMVQSVLMVLVIASVVVGGMRLAGGSIQMLSTRSEGAIQSPTLVVNLAKGAVATLGIFLVLQNLGINITPLITALGIGGLAVALALQDTLSNLFAGVQIILSRQIRPRDYVQLSSAEEGVVTDVKARYTTITTVPDGNLLAVPNALLASSIVKNYSFPHDALWVSVDVGVSYDSDLEEVERIALDVARDVMSGFEGASERDQPLVFFHTFGGSSIDFEVRLMVRDFRSQAPAQHEFIKRLHRRFNAEGIEIPFPIRTLIMQPPEGGLSGATTAAEH